ncbi:MAG: gamma-glutamyltransferase [Candidatus Marinimicrobia bacterium]|jgi:gamma-glutamyltranspeptidase/glutathione hydrolase|nr:gamma-glutamyltransferase [Candidatus Neomarinimicrobiota bacterium]MBT3943895.1 gamma-glutamyltransferase [Candidatus Neomarinimicrobiota bacterium]MBT4111909.1 gamma-glutamyltransferase [Candidatus Neomarinimicrobiota bacterium]MBT4316822.1 gamma-glutamyltransferase [Candidatus Neomarinimicrobiota bacterium]MBT4706387.1 gamma-glutamyltransferase [Candidatus Neomarinimicrobiota bacterium]
MRIDYTILTSILLLFFSCNTPENSKGGVSSTSSIASQVGIDILEQGGNAFDAIVATGFTLAVTSPSNGNLGGGGFLVAQTSDGEKISLDFREEAPALSYETMFLDENQEYSRDLALNSHKSSGVPGTVNGLIQIFNDYGSGKFTLEELLVPAIFYAENGHRINAEAAQGFDSYKALFLNDEGSTKIFVKNVDDTILNIQKAFQDGKLSQEDYTKQLASIDEWLPGDLLVQTDLANTLKRIAKYGNAGFYDGETAELIIREMDLNDGFITKEDLLSYKSIYRDPIVGTYRGNKIISMGPPSSGGALLVQMLNMLENFDIKSMERNSTEFVHLLTEVQRLAYADRAIHLGDPDFWPNPIPMLTSKTYAKERLALISMDSATRSTEIAAGKNLPQESIETTHYSVMDKEGNVVGITTTLNMSYGSKKVVDGAGFLLNNEMDDFSSKPGTANAFGLVGYKANAIQPFKRPLSSMSPTLVIDTNGNPIVTIGAAGGSRIITAVLQNIISIVDHGLNIQEAIDFPRTHSQWLPDNLRYEKGALTQQTINELEELNHLFEHDGVTENGLYGIAQTHGVHFKNKQFITGFDKRGSYDENEGITY